MSEWECERMKEWKKPEKKKSEKKKKPWNASVNVFRLYFIIIIINLSVLLLLLLLFLLPRHLLLVFFDLFWNWIENSGTISPDSWLMIWFFSCCILFCWCSLFLSLFLSLFPSFSLSLLSAGLHITLIDYRLIFFEWFITDLVVKWWSKTTTTTAAKIQEKMKHFNLNKLTPDSQQNANKNLKQKKNANKKTQPVV